MAAFSLFRLGFWSEDKKIPEFSASPKTPTELAILSNPGPSLATFQIPKYIEDDLQQIVKTILGVQPFIGHGQDRRTSKNPPEWASQLKVLEVYKSKSYMNYYNFIQKCKEYFATSKFRGCNRVLFAVTFLRKKALNQQQQYRCKIEVKILIPPTWAEFEVFLQKSLGETHIFIDNIGQKFHKVSQYQLENVIDQSAYMKYLQSILKKFNDIAALKDNLLIWYF